MKVDDNGDNDDKGPSNWYSGEGAGPHPPGPILGSVHTSLQISTLFYFDTNSFLTLSQTWNTVCVCVLVAQSCPTLCDPTDCGLPKLFKSPLMYKSLSHLFLNCLFCIAV